MPLTCTQAIWDIKKGKITHFSYSYTSLKPEAYAYAQGKKKRLCEKKKKKKTLPEKKAQDTI